MSKLLKALFLAFIFVLLGTLTPSSASAQIFWSTPAQINTSSNHATLPSTVTGPNGYLHTVWTEFDPNAPIAYWNGVQNPGIFYSYWNGDAWSAPKQIAQNTSFAAFPSIAVTSNNVVHVVWEDDSENPAGSLGRILHSYSSDYGANWSTPISASGNLDTIAGSGSWFPHLVKDNADNLHLVFVYSNDLEGPYAYYTKWNGSSWLPPQRVMVSSINENINDTDLAIDSNNLPHVVLEQQGGDPDNNLGRGIYYTSYNGSTWTAPTRLDADLFPYFPRIIIDSAGNRHVIWSATVMDIYNNWFYNHVAYVKNTGSGWTAPFEVTKNVAWTGGWGYPIAGITSDSQNNIYVGWGEAIGWPNPNPTELERGIQISYRKWSAGGTWSSSVFMRYAYDFDVPFLYKDKWDNQHFAWTEQSGPGQPWSLWYSTVPMNVNSYNPATGFTMTLANTTPGDTLNVPAGAYAQTATISAQIGPLPASANPGYTTIPRSYTYRPHGLQFAANKAATAVICYTDAELVGADEKNLKVYIWDGQTNSWSTSFTTKTNTTLNKSTVTLPHFSLYGLMAPKAKVDWLPPIAKAELYELKDGSTLPVKFSLVHFDETPLDPPELADDVTVVVRDTNGNEKVSYQFGIGNNNVRFDPTTNQYIANVHTKELNLRVGTFTVEVLIFGQPQLTGTTNFKITEPGKVRGTSTP